MFNSLSLKVIIFGFIFTFFSSFGQSFFLGLFNSSIRETLSITDRAYLLFEGEILKSGTSADLANDEEARRLYLGEKFRLD